jgi:hypothetical protein
LTRRENGSRTGVLDNRLFNFLVDALDITLHWNLLWILFQAQAKQCRRIFIWKQEFVGFPRSNLHGSNVSI